MAVLLWPCSRCILSVRSLVSFVFRPPGCPPPLPSPPANLTLRPTPHPPEARFLSRGRVPAAVLLGPVRVDMEGLDKSKKNTKYSRARENLLLSASRPRPGVVLLMPQYHGRNEAAGVLQE